MSDLENDLKNTFVEETENRKEVHLRDLIENKRITAIYVFNDIKDAHFITGDNTKDDSDDIEEDEGENNDEQ